MAQGVSQQWDTADTDVEEASHLPQLQASTIAQPPVDSSISSNGPSSLRQSSLLSSTYTVTNFEDSILTICGD